MELMQAIKGRRSIRRYKPDPVSDELLNQVLEAGRWAPSWANTQCWRFVVVRDPEIKSKLSETAFSPGSRGNPAASAIKDAPVLIVACGKLKRAGYYKGMPMPLTDKGDWWYMFDVALATQNIMLQAYALGLGTVPVGLFDAPRVAQILELPQDVVPVILLPLGYPDEEPKVPTRMELSELVFYDKYM